MSDDSRQTPEELVQAFAAAENFPQDRHGVLALAQALKRAAVDFHVSMDRIVQECCDSSRWCPTPRDIRNVAIALRDAIGEGRKTSQHAEWERIYGPAKPEWSAELLGLLGAESHEERVKAIHRRACMDTLYYTEGEGMGTGDVKFWEQARKANMANYRELMDQVRVEGGWRTERELEP